jgi:hypothetical protein
MIHSKRRIAVVIVILLIISLILTMDETFNPIGRPSSAPPAVTVLKSICNRPPGFILIIADLSGFNNSVGHGAPLHPWPIVPVQKGDMVHFLVCNHDETQPHGFAIRYYLDAGVAMAPGEAYQIIFQATEVGVFDIYCNIFCTIHVFMRGQLIVSE